jgi:hypothetical protein
MKNPKKTPKKKNPKTNTTADAPRQSMEITTTAKKPVEEDTQEAGFR